MEEWDEYHEEEPSRIGRIILSIVGGLMILLLLSYFLFSDVLSNTIGSETLNNSTLEISGYIIRFHGDALDKLQQEYVDNQEREIKACLYGAANGRNYSVNNVTFPEIIDASVAHVRTAGCAADPIVTLHSHPVKRCLASQQDIDNYRTRKAANPKLLLMIMCDIDRFALIDRYE